MVPILSEYLTVLAKKSQKLTFFWGWDDQIQYFTRIFPKNSKFFIPMQFKSVSKSQKFAKCYIFFLAFSNLETMIYFTCQGESALYNIDLYVIDLYVRTHSHALFIVLCSYFDHKKREFYMVIRKKIVIFNIMIFSEI